MGRVRGIWAVGSNQHRKVPQPPAPTPDARMVEVMASHAFAVESDPFVPLPRNAFSDMSRSSRRRGTLIPDDSANVPNPLLAPAQDVADYENSDGYALIEVCGFDRDETVDVDPSELCANQADVDDDLVEMFVDDAPTEPIQVVRWGGSLYIRDGNHRAVAALRAGRTVVADVMWLDD